VPRLARDRVTWLIYAQLGLFGYFLYGFGPVVPLLRDEQGTSLRVGGLHGTGVAIGALLGGVLFPILARRVGRGRVMWAGTFGLAGGVAILCLARPVHLTVAATVVVATFGIVLVSGVVAALSELHGDAGPAAISEANAVCAGMGVLAPLVIGLTVQTGLGWRPGLAILVALVGLLALVAFLSGVRLPPGPRAGGVWAEERSDEGSRQWGGGGRRQHYRLPGRYWTAWCSCVSPARSRSAFRSGRSRRSGATPAWRPVRRPRPSPASWPACSPAG
jgi:MFS family permease